MTSIDFTQLLRDAKKQARQSKQTNPISEKTVVSLVNKSSSQPCTEIASWNPLDTTSLAFHNLKLQKVCSNPPSIYYSQSCFEDTQPLWNWLVSLPYGESGIREWKTMPYGKRKVCMFPDPLPPPLSIIAQHLVQTGIFTIDQPPNHVLLNEYQPSQGILPHTDGPRYASRTATLSLGSDVILQFSKRLSPDQIGTSTTDTWNHLVPTPSILLEADSWIVFEETAYLDYCHGIAMDVWEDVTDDQCLNAPAGVRVPRGRRFSLTFRHHIIEAS